MKINPRSVRMTKEMGTSPIKGTCKKKVVGGEKKRGTDMEAKLVHQKEVGVSMKEANSWADIVKKKKDCRKGNVRVERVTPQLGNKRSQKEAGAVPENSGKRRCSGTVAIILDGPVERQTKVLE